MAKEFKSTNELIEILTSKGVSIKEENNVRYLIEKYSYYSIVNFYKWIFKIGENYKKMLHLKKYLQCINLIKI